MPPHDGLIEALRRPLDIEQRVPIDRLMTTHATSAAGRLAHLGVLRFSGSDSLSFLQGQVSNDTRRLAESQSLLAAYSSPQGRVLAVMHFLPHSSGIIGILPRELIPPTLDALRKFVLRAKVKIEDAGEIFGVAGLFGVSGLEKAGLAAPQSSGAYQETDGIGIAAVNRDPGRCWIIGDSEKLAERGLAGLSPPDQVEHDWRLADIRAGLPQIYLNTREAFVAQMLNLDLIDGISFSKGCYTGQEIIARTQHLGRIKRRLYRLQLPAADWRIGQPLQLSDGRSGRLVEAIQSGSGFEALAVLQVEPAERESIAGAAVAAATLPLPYQV
jgi:folate-binding protein YgfZ